MDIEPLKCNWCDSEYIPVNDKQRFCLPICRLDYYAKKAKIKARNAVLDEVLSISGPYTEIFTEVECMKEEELV